MQYSIVVDARTARSEKWEHLSKSRTHQRRHCYRLRHGRQPCIILLQDGGDLRLTCTIIFYLEHMAFLKAPVRILQTKPIGRERRSYRATRDCSQAQRANERATKTVQMRKPFGELILATRAALQVQILNSWNLERKHGGYKKC